MISLRRTDFARFRVVVSKRERERVVSLFSAGPSSTSGVCCESGAGDIMGHDDLETYVLVVHADDAESIERVEGLVKG
jgi:hypothetical protein